MEKKRTIISLTMIIILVACAVAYIFFSGLVAHKYNYVQIEVNPRVEFICDKKFDVVSVYPLNDDAKIVLSDLDLIGLDVDEATTVFIDECAKCGFIDVNGVDNATNITVIDGITQALDVRVTHKVYNYFRQNEIMSAVTETYEDRTMFDKKKENKVYCANKYKLITTIMESDPELNIKDIKDLSEVELVDMVIEKHESNKFTPTEEIINKKNTLISNNKENYDTHINSISENSQREFSELFDDYQKLSGKRYKEDFTKEYNDWQKNHVL